MVIAKQISSGAKRLFSGTEVACIRGNRMLFQNLSFTLNPGEVLHLTGANGAGKTSLLRIFCGALPVAQGRIDWAGEDFLKDGTENHAARFSFLPADDRSLKNQETALENLSFWAAFWGENAKACHAALDTMHLKSLKDTPVRRFSAGQKRRLGLARTFLKKAPLWLLDEPLNGLDHDATELFAKALDTHCRDGGMAAVASHDILPPLKHATLRKLPVGV